MRYCVRRIINILKFGRMAHVLIVAVLGFCFCNNLFACGEGCDTDSCCSAACGPTCYLDTQFSSECVCDEQPEPELPLCEHGDYLKWNGTSWVCDHCPSKYPMSDGGYYHLASGCYLIDTQVCGGTCLIHADGDSYCSGEASGKHLEYDANDNLVCYSNNLSCADFLASGCTQSAQSGTAHWTTVWNTDNVIHNPWEYYIHDYMVWNVDECKCEQNVSYHNCGAIRTLNSTNNVVTDMLGRGPYEQAVYSRKDSIKYASVGHYYCTHCDAGQKPLVFDKTNVPRTYSGCEKDDTGSYVACACTDVEVGYYSAGCDFNSDYPLSSLTLPAGAAMCHQQCPAGMTTSGAGASSCVPDTGAQIYCASTGCFRIGTNLSVCQP